MTFEKGKGSKGDGEEVEKKGGVARSTARAIPANNADGGAGARRKTLELRSSVESAPFGSDRPSAQPKCARRGPLRRVIPTRTKFLNSLKFASTLLAVTYESLTNFSP